jgi:hypothetical protein
MKNYTEEEVLKAIDKSKGSITTISRRLKCSWHCADNYVNRWDSTKQAKRDEVEKMCDTAESVIYEKIEDEKDAQCAKWYLSSRDTRTKRI